jgi:hypothetical protein
MRSIVWCIVTVTVTGLLALAQVRDAREGNRAEVLVLGTCHIYRTKLDGVGKPKKVQRTPKPAGIS